MKELEQSFNCVLSFIIQSEINIPLPILHLMYEI